MKDKDKTKAQLIGELTTLRQRIAKMEAMARKQQKVEEALRESEERFRTFIETANGLMNISDKKRGQSTRHK